MRKVHSKVRGTDPVTGLPYSADDPETQVWVHAVEWHSFLAAYRTYAGGLSDEDQDRYLSEGVRIAALLGTPEEMVPASRAEYREYFESVRPRLCMSESARDAIDFVLHPPLTPRPAGAAGAAADHSAAALATVPRHLRQLAGIDRPVAARRRDRGGGAPGRRGDRAAGAARRPGAGARPAHARDRCSSAARGLRS